MQLLASLSEALESIHLQLSARPETDAQLAAAQPATTQPATTQPAANLHPPPLQQLLSQCQRTFQEILACLAGIDLSPAVEQQVRPAQTEAYRLLRLLNVDIIKLTAAKQPESVARLRSQLISQTERLQGFVQAIAQVLQQVLQAERR